MSAAIQLINLATAMYGWPMPEDPVQQREDEKARANWGKLYRAFGIS